jgi:glycosyltransferase involved in cell wall biosynthesis
MFVSVIIPIYNVEQYIEACVRSVAAQRFTDYEIIAVDDCSQDNSMKVFHDTIERLGIAKDMVKVIHHEENRGLSAARNTGILASQAQYVYFLDSDDTITPDCIGKMVERSNYRGRDMEMVVGEYSFNGPALGSPHIGTKKHYLGRKEYIRAYCKNQIFPMAWNRLVLREFILKYNIFFEEGLIHEDTLWNFQVLQYVRSVAIVHDVTYVYRVRQNSLQTNDDFVKHFKANVYIVGKIADIMFSSRRLKCNKYVYDFVEEEKQRHLRDCRISGHAELIRELYLTCRQKPHYKPLAALMLFGYHEGILRKIIKRDRHYAMSFERGLEYFMRLGS